MTYNRSITYNDIIVNALTENGVLTEGENISGYQMELGRRHLNNILDRLEVLGIRLFRREWRERVVEASDVRLVDANPYTAIKSHSVGSISTWSALTSYLEGDLVYPSEYNGYYYKATVAGTSDTTEPAFPLKQDATIIDGTVTWQCLPDTKPGYGAIWESYWVPGGTSTTNWSINATYICGGEYDLLSDEIEILKAELLSGGEKLCNLKIVSDSEYGEWAMARTGQPQSIYLSRTNGYNSSCKIFPIPDQRYNLRMLVNLKITSAEDGANDIVDFPDMWENCLTYMLSSSLCVPFNVPNERFAIIDAMASQFYKELTAVDNQDRVGGRRITPQCY